MKERRKGREGKLNLSEERLFFGGGDVRFSVQSSFNLSFQLFFPRSDFCKHLDA